MAVERNIEIAARIATLIFIKYININPITHEAIAKNKASFGVISFFGKGRFCVLFISLSKSLSIIWLKILEELTIRIPPETK